LPEPHRALAADLDLKDFIDRQSGKLIGRAEDARGAGQGA
jgi:hypothetical protein